MGFSSLFFFFFLFLQIFAFCGLSVSLTFLRDACADRAREKKECDIPLGDYSLLAPCFYFLARPFLIPSTVTHTHTHTRLFTLQTPLDFSLKNKKDCCTYRQTAGSQFSSCVIFKLFLFYLFFCLLHPLVQRAVNFDRCVKDVNENERGQRKTGGD